MAPLPNGLRTAADRLRAGLPGLRAVVLFGSHARGDAIEGSDYDLFVIADGLPEHPVERGDRVRKVLGDVGLPVQAMVRSPAAFEGRLESIYLDIALDGVILHDTDGWFAARQARLREIIDEAGLYRVRAPGGFSWRWKNPPPQGDWELEWDGLHVPMRRRVAAPLT